jgi:hypothetical protein
MSVSILKPKPGKVNRDGYSTQRFSVKILMYYRGIHFKDKCQSILYQETALVGDKFYRKEYRNFRKPHWDPSLTFSAFRVAAAFSYSGFIFLQWPHQGA